MDMTIPRAVLLSEISLRPSYSLFSMTLPMRRGNAAVGVEADKGGGVS